MDATAQPIEAARRDRLGNPAAPARVPLYLTLAVILLGALERWWAAAHTVGTLTSDGAVIGLMALRLLHHGQLSVYMWGQSYGGSLEAVLTAIVFAVAGTGTSQLLAATALSSALCAVALWWAGRHIVGEPAAQLGALAFWVWPASFLWRSVKPGGTYMIGLAIALCAVGALARIRQGDDDWRNCGFAGLLCGLAVWSSPMSLELLIPVAVWLIPTFRRLGRRLLAGAAGALLGGLPAVIYGAMHDWRNLHMPGYRADLLSGAPARFRQFFTTEAPIAMSVRVEGTFAWLGGHAGQVLAWAAAAALVATAWQVILGRAARCTLPVITLALLPFLYAFIPLADHAGQGRYALFAVPMAALLIGAGLERAGASLQRLTRDMAGRSRNAQPAGAQDPAVAPQAQAIRPAGPAARLGPARWLVWTAGLGCVALLGAIGLHDEPGSVLVGLPTPDVPMPANDSPLLALLSEHGVRDAYAPYWIAYRVTFETGQRTKVASLELDRDPLIAATVSASRDPAYLFVSRSRTLRRFETWCDRHKVGYQAWHRRSFTVVQPRSKVDPEKLPRTVLG